MATEIVVQLTKTGTTASLASIRSHSVVIDRPTSKGGADQGPMGGELLLAALGGCFGSTLFAALDGRGMDVHDIGITVSGTLEEAPNRFSAIHMRVVGDTADQERFERMVNIAERSCIVANTLKHEVRLSVQVEQSGEVA